jgi:hypothetical protein
MTSQSPRIYLYKITFEEVLYYYYGVHKEKKFDEYYMGSPVTHKWCWELYTPKKQILQFFDFTDEGWLKAQEVEKRLIKPIYNKDKWCLNESCGGIVSLEVLREIGRKNYELGLGIHSLTYEEKSKNGRIGGLIGGKIGGLKLGKKGGAISGKQNYENGIGIHALTLEEKAENARKGHETQKKLAIGFWGFTLEKRQENGRKGEEKRKERNVGLYALTKEEKSEAGKKSAQKLHSERWACLETGHITNAGALTRFQKHRGIDTSKRKRIE